MPLSLYERRIQLGIPNPCRIIVFPTINLQTKPTENIEFQQKVSDFIGFGRSRATNCDTVHQNTPATPASIIDPGPDLRSKRRFPGGGESL